MLQFTQFAPHFNYSWGVMFGVIARVPSVHSGTFLAPRIMSRSHTWQSLKGGGMLIHRPWCSKSTLTSCCTPYLSCHANYTYMWNHMLTLISHISYPTSYIMQVECERGNRYPRANFC